MEVRDRGLGGWIGRRARAHPTDDALVDGARALDYRSLADRVTAVAAGFAELGVRPGDRVSYSGPAGHAYVESLFAATLLGAAFTPINPRHPDEVAAAIIADARPTISPPTS